MWLNIFVILAALLVGLSAKYYWNSNPDNPVEQAAEMVIEKEADIAVDFTPDKNERKG